MTNVMKNQKGFTLLEIIVVLAVLGALAAMLSPVVFRYIDDANRARTQADARVIATAIQRMYADTGRWPFYADGNGQTAYQTGVDADYLVSGTCLLSNTATDTLGECGVSTAMIGSAAGWTAANKADGLTRQLVTNEGASTIQYTATSTFPRAWKGPYTDAIPAVDAWGNPYVVNIGDAAGTQAVFVASAGSNGILETSADTAATTNLTAGGDDIIARVK
jgi:prepilin-type N-terminal cleavage/methylation domain-containing protein